MDKQIKIASEKIKGPKTSAPEKALEGFIRSNNIEKKNLYKSETEKGEFFFADIKQKEIDVLNELKSIIPEGFSLSQLALKWILMHDAVSVIIPGAKILIKPCKIFLHHHYQI